MASVVRAVVAFVIALVPATFIVTSAGADTLTGALGYVAFAPPASGANGSYSDSIRYPNAYSVPSVSDGVSGDTFTFVASGSSGCSIGAKGSGFSYANAGVCSITASSVRSDDDAASGGSDADPDDTVFTGTLVLTILKATQSISISSQSVSIATSIALKASGFLGSGAVTYAVVGGTASGCSISASNKLTSSSSGTCLVTASIAADSIYSAATSSPATMTFSVPVTPPPPTTTTSTTTTSTTTTTTTTTTIPVPPPVHIISSPPQVAAPTSVVIGPFAEGSFALNAKMKKQIKAMALVVKDKKYKSVDLAGYTDNVFSPAFNLALIQSRASAVAAQLTLDLAALGDTKVTVTIVAGGPVIVLASNSTAKGRAANRRVVATLTAS